MTPTQILHSAAELLSDPSKRCVGVLARNANGEPVHSDSPNAVCFCLIGAIAKVTGSIESDESGFRAFTYWETCDLAKDILQVTTLVGAWELRANGRSQDEVVALLLEATAE